MPEVGAAICPVDLHSENAMAEMPTGEFVMNSVPLDEMPTLLERFRIIGVLGRGGMGTVYKAFHLNLKRFVAIKTLRCSASRHSKIVQRFLREMESIGQLDHENVVRASDAGEKNGVLHLVMEFLPGLDLNKIVAERGPFAVRDACELVRQTARGLAYIHLSMIHRDIKPSNLLLTTSGIVKILDLGLARLHEGPIDGEATPEGAVLGTYDYMAPEQVTGSAETDRRADIYSLGCTLFKLIVGHAPYSSDDYSTPAKKMFAHGNVPISQADGFDKIPAELRPILLRMTAKNPASRYANAEEVAIAIAPFAKGSVPARLLNPGDIKESAAPLSRPQRDELSLLTQPPHDTPLNTLSSVSALSRLTQPRGIAWLAALTAVVIGITWFFAGDVLGRRNPTLQPFAAPLGAATPATNEGDDEPAAEPRNLDP